MNEIQTTMKAHNKVWLHKENFLSPAVIQTCCCFQDEEHEDFLSVGRAMEEIADDPVDCYWLIKCFVNQFQTKFGDSIPHLVSIQSMFLLGRTNDKHGFR